MALRRALFLCTIMLALVAGSAWANHVGDSQVCGVGSHGPCTVPGPITNTNTNTNISQNSNQNNNNNRNSNDNSNTNVNVNQNRNRQNQSQGQYQGQGQSQIGINKQGQGQGQSLTNQPNQTIEGDNVKVYAPAPSANAPALAAHNCMGSWSAAVSASPFGIGGGGLGFGSTTESVPCNRRANAIVLFTMASEVQDGKLLYAALLLLANDKETLAALQSAGAPGFEKVTSKQDASITPAARVNADHMLRSESRDPYDAVRPDWYQQREF